YAENTSIADVTFSVKANNTGTSEATVSITIKLYAGGDLVFNKTYTKDFQAGESGDVITLDELIADINDASGGKLIASKDSSGTKLVLVTPNGETISAEVSVTDANNILTDGISLAELVQGASTTDITSGNTGSAVKVGTLTLMGAEDFNVQGQGIKFFDTATNGTFTSLNNIDVTTNKGAQIAQVIIQSAVRQVDTIRSQIGSTIINLQAIYDAQAVAKDNMDNAESVIRNVDFAKEMTEFTKYQIRMQSGVAMLAQANTLPQLVLQLLR
ncbi:MAG TPA: flagellin, partial [Aquificaceae bacterium]|nr:flagellin [Aquificaceae bacterium]